MSLSLLNRIALVLAFVGLTAAGYLAVTHQTGVNAACGTGGCAKVEAYVMQHWNGFPVALPGVVAYLALIAMCIVMPAAAFPPNVRKMGLILAAAGALASVGLTVFSLAVIHAECLWCLGSACAMVGLAVVFFLMNRVQDVPEKKGFGLEDWGLVAGLALAGSLVGYVAYPKIDDSHAVDGKHMSDFMPEHPIQMGDDNAPVTVVEFGDLMCLYCRASYGELRDKMKKDPGKMRLIWRHFPLFRTEGHELSLSAAVIGELCAEKGKFWQYFETLIQKEPASTRPEDLISAAVALGIDREEIKKRAPEPKDPAFLRMKADMDLADSLGLQYTPTFIMPAAGDRVRVYRHNTFREPLDELLKEAKTP